MSGPPNDSSLKYDFTHRIGGPHELTSVPGSVLMQHGRTFAAAQLGAPSAGYLQRRSLPRRTNRLESALDERWGQRVTVRRSGTSLMRGPRCRRRVATEQLAERRERGPPRERSDQQ